MTTQSINIQSSTSSNRRTVTRSPLIQNNLVPAKATATNTHHDRRERDFGVGYGNSSGYSTGKRYASNWGNARFHCG